MESLMSFLPLIIFGALAYFMLIRPQKKQADAKKQMIDRLKKGDKIVNIGGLHGIVDEVDHDSNTVVIDCEGVYLTFAIHAVAQVIPDKSTKVVETQETEDNKE